MKKTITRNRLRSLGQSGAAVAAAALVSALCVVRPAHADAWALLIGIDQYEDSDNIARLGGAGNDATALAKALIECSGFPADHVRTLVSINDLNQVKRQKPTQHSILHELEALRQRVQPGDTVFVAYSGHGVESEHVPYLLPYDADISTPALIRDNSIPEEKFRDYLKNVPAKALILVFDMCRVNADKSGRGAQEDAQMSGAQVRGLDFSQVVKTGGTTTDAATPLDRPQIVAEFFACAPNTRSYEWKDKERGYFSYYLEQGLRGAAKATGGGVSLDSLKRYLAASVPKAVRENELGKTQTPTGNILGPLDAGDFVVANAAVAPDNGIDTRARLKIHVNAPNPTLTVDAHLVAAGSDYVVDLGAVESKKAFVIVTADGYEGDLFEVTLKRGQTVTLDATLMKSVGH